MASKCAKCGSDRQTTKYVPKNSALNHWRYCMQFTELKGKFKQPKECPEFLTKACLECGYDWAEPCLDAEKK